MAYITLGGLRAGITLKEHYIVLGRTPETKVVKDVKMLIASIPTSILSQTHTVTKASARADTRCAPACLLHFVCLLHQLHLVSQILSVALKGEKIDSVHVFFETGNVYQQILIVRHGKLRYGYLK